MPKNNNLEPVKLPMELKFGVKPATEFKNNLDAIKVTLLQAPTMDDLRKYLPAFVEATWAPQPDANDVMSKREADKLIRDALTGKTLPTALETIRLTFRIEGISLQEVTHIIRYRKASFSADCSGDKWWTDRDALVPHSIQQSTDSKPSDGPWNGDDSISKGDFYGRYKKIVEMAKELYCDMIDSKEISIMDARYILPRCLSTFYYMSMSLGDAIHFIKQRIDKQIQPETDNILAYQMYIEILKQYPIANGLIDIHAPSMFYIKMARTGKATNLYFPDEDSDDFEWNEKDFIYQKYRRDMNGTGSNSYNHFEQLMYSYEMMIANVYANNTQKLLDEYYEEEQGQEKP